MLYDSRRHPATPSSSIRLPSFAEGFGSIPRPSSNYSSLSHPLRLANSWTRTPSAPTPLEAYRQRQALRQISLSSLSRTLPSSGSTQDESYLFDFSPPRPLFSPTSLGPSLSSTPASTGPPRTPHRAWEHPTIGLPPSSVSNEARNYNDAFGLEIRSTPIVQGSNILGNRPLEATVHSPSLHRAASSPHLAVSSDLNSQRQNFTSLDTKPSFDAQRSPVLPPTLWRSQSLARMKMQPTFQQEQQESYRSLSAYDEREEDTSSSSSSVTAVSPSTYDSPASSDGANLYTPPSSLRPRATGRAANPSLPKKYLCPHCDQKFARLNDQQRHSRSHTGECPFTCGRCGMAFKRSDARRRHEIKADCL